MGMTQAGAAAVVGVERRTRARRNVVDSHLVTVDLAFQSGALLLDLSETGIGVQALSAAPLGTTTSLHFELPEIGARIEGKGTVAWTDSSGRVGIRFDEIGEMGRRYLEQWLSRNGKPQASTARQASPNWPPQRTRDEIAALRRDLAAQKLEGDAALQFMVERTRSITRATGAAIALERDGAIICRASSGNAPEVGAELNPASGLSGECIRTGEIVRCEDTETDPRADRLVCRKLDLRCALIVPVRLQGKVVGVLEAFSSQARAFQNSDVLLLRRITDLVIGITVKGGAAESRDIHSVATPSVPGILPAPEEQPAPATTSIPQEPVRADQEEIALAAPAEPIAPPAPEPVAQVPEGQTRTSAPPEQQSLANMVGANAATATLTIDPPLAEPAPPPAPLREPAARRPRRSQMPRIPTPAAAEPERDLLQELSEEDESTLKLKRIVSVAAAFVLLLTLGLIGWRVARPRAVANAPAAPATQPASAPAETATTAQPPVTGATITVPVDPTRIPPPATPLPGASKPTAANKTPAKTEAKTDDAEVVVIVPTGRTLPKSSTPDMQPPSLAVARTGEEPVAISSLLSTKMSTPTLAKPEVSRGMTGGKLLRRYDPFYPPSARAMRLGGKVTLKATVDKTGKVSKVTVVSGNPLLTTAAVDAVKRWKYEPFELNGNPLEVENTITFNFQPPPGP